MRLYNLFVRYANNLFNWCNFCDIALYYLYKAYFSLPRQCLIFHDFHIQYCSFVLNTVLLATKEFPPRINTLIHHICVVSHTR
jgi:hypothetical protein